MMMDNELKHYAAAARRELVNDSSTEQKQLRKGKVAQVSRRTIIP